MEKYVHTHAHTHAHAHARTHAHAHARTHAHAHAHTHTHQYSGIALASFVTLQYALPIQSTKSSKKLVSAPHI